MRINHALLLGLGCAATFFAVQVACGRAQRRLPTLETRVADACASYRAGHPGARVCDPETTRPLVVPLLKANREKLAHARAALERGEPSTAERDLGEVMDAATAIANERSLLAKLVAGTLVDESLRVLEPSSLSASARRAIVARAPTTLDEPAALSARLDGEARLLRWAHEHWFFQTGLGDRILSSAMKENARVYDAIGDAVDHGDRAACERAADPAGHHDLPPPLTSRYEDGRCAQLVHVHAIGVRLRAMRRS